MPLFISTDLIKRIADHHDAHPKAYQRFQEGRVILETREGGLVREVRDEVIRRGNRISDVVNALAVRGNAPARLVIGAGDRYVLVYKIRV